MTRAFSSKPLERSRLWLPHNIPRSLETGVRRKEYNRRTDERTPFTKVKFCLFSATDTVMPHQNIEMNQQDIKEVESSSTHVDVSKGNNASGFAIHTQQERTAEEKNIERRLLWKVDLTILPALSLVYFLASMVSNGHPPFLA
jgi:hypothetical protein